MNSFLTAEAVFRPFPCKIQRRLYSSVYEDINNGSCYHASGAPNNMSSTAIDAKGDDGTFVMVSPTTTCLSPSSLPARAQVCIFCGGLSSTIQIQPQLWSQLPHELIERIMAFLPVWSIFRFRAVCKSWQSLVCSRTFLRLRTGLHYTSGGKSSARSLASMRDVYKKCWHCQGVPIVTDDGTHDAKVCFLALNRARYQQLSAYEVRSKKWHTFPVNFLPGIVYPVAAAKGLICFSASDFETGHVNLLVCNPLTRCWKELPSMCLPQRRMPFFVSMVVDREGLSYKVLVAGGLSALHLGYGDVNEGETSTEIYDSSIGKWALCEPDIPQNEIIENVGTAEHYRYYLCLTGSTQFRAGARHHHNLINRGNEARGTSSHGLLAFNLHKQMWMKMPTGRIPGYSKFRHLIECEGCILIVGKALRQNVLGLYIWCLDHNSLRWKELGKMPQAIFEQFFSSPSECFYCAALGHHIFFCRYFCNQALIYNIWKNSWHQVAGCPLLTHPLILPLDPGLDPVD